MKTIVAVLAALAIVVSANSAFAQTVGDQKPSTHKGKEHRGVGKNQWGKNGTPRTMSATADPTPPPPPPPSGGHKKGAIQMESKVKGKRHPPNFVIKGNNH